VRVLVTGAAGFVGTAVVRCLQSSGHQVAALTHVTQPAGIAELRPGDILDAVSLGKAVAGIDAVCHLAALTRVRESFLDPVAYFQVNVTGTVNLLHAMDIETTRAGRPLGLVLASTGAVYGAPARQPISEDEIPAPGSPYGASKLAAEVAVACQARTGKIGSIVLRAFNIAGAVAGRGDDDLSRIIPKTLAVAAGRSGQLHVNGDGTAVREYLHVADFAHACARAIESCEPGTHRVYNAGSGTGTTVRDIITAAEQTTGRPVAVSWDPPHPEPEVLLADSSRIRAALGWKPSRSDLDEIMSDAWQAMQCQPMRASR
jgi:UDP-glucose 4-epimerase